MITYHHERLCNCLEEMKPLLAEHWEEIAHFKDKVKLNPNYEAYVEMEDAGVLEIYTVRHMGILVGYSVYTVAPNLHYSNDSYAINDVVFIAEEYRKTDLGKRLLTFSEGRLIDDRGVSVIMISMKANKPFQQLLEKLDYNLFEYNYSKYVGGVS